MNRVLLIPILLVLLWGCAKSNLAENIDQSTPITISIDKESIARGSVVDSEVDMATVGMYCTHYKSSDPTVAVEKMNNKQYSYSESAWRQVGDAITWDYISIQDTYTFYAYSPYSGSSEHGITPLLKDGALNITYTVPTSCANQKDLLVATPRHKIPPQTGGKVQMLFNHVLSKVSFSIKGGGKKIKSITLTNIKNKGTLVWNSTESTYVWKDVIGAESFTVSADDADLDGTLESTSTAKPVTTSEGHLFMIPQQIDNTKGINIQVINGSDIENITLKLPNSSAWEAGESYNYIIDTDGECSLYLITERVFIKGYGADGISGEVSIKAENLSDGYPLPKLIATGSNANITTGTITKSENGTITTYIVPFTAKAAGNINFICGSETQTIPVSYDATLYSALNSTTIANVTASSVTGITNTGFLAKNDEYVRKEFTGNLTIDGKNVAFYGKQASNFVLEVGETPLEEGDETIPSAQHEYTGKGSRLGSSGKEAVNEVTYDFTGLDVTVSCVIDSHYNSAWSQSPDGMIVTVAAPPINHIVDSKPTDFADHVGNSKIILENPAGDKKEYLIKQTQHKPVYFLSSELSDLTFDTYFSNSKKRFIRTVNIYNTNKLYNDVVTKSISFVDEDKDGGSKNIGYFLSIGVHDPLEVGVDEIDQAKSDAALWGQVYRSDNGATWNWRWWSATIKIQVSDKWNEIYEASFYTIGKNL